MVTEFDNIRERVQRTKHAQVYENQADVDREYLMDMVGLQQQALDLALPEMDYDKRFKAVHETLVNCLADKELRKEDATTFANYVTAKVLEALDHQMEVPYE